MTTNAKKIRVAIQYGIAGGERRTLRFRNALTAAGYEVVKRSTDADIIIGHSAGCFWLPAAPTHQKLLLIDPPYWPGKSVRQRGRDRAKSNFQYRKYHYATRHWLQQNLWSIFYSLKDFKRTKQIIDHAATYDLAKIIRNHQVHLVRNDNDDWLTGDKAYLALLYQANPKLTITHLPGDHDDCLYNPEPYVLLLQHFYT